MMARMSFFRQNQIIFSVQLDFRTAVLGNENPVAGLDGEFDQGAFLVAASGTYGDHFSFLRFFLGGVRQEQTAGGFGFSFNALDQHTLSEGFDVSHSMLCLFYCR